MLARLEDGTRVVIRPIRPHDKAMLAEAVLRLSPAAAQARFLTPKPRLTDRELRYLTEVDGTSHCALVAVLYDDPGTLAGVGRWVRLREDPRVAEIAVVVTDAYQRLGLGRRLGLLLADRARRQGVRRFTALMFSENVAAHRLMRSVSAHLVASHVDRGVKEVVAELAA